MLEPGQNTGFVAVEPSIGESIRGAESAILSTVTNPSGDWRPYLPTNACQLMMSADGTKNYGDTNACVSFAGCQDLETLLNFQLKTSAMSADNAAWLAANGYIDVGGSVYLSKRFTAKQSGTDPNVGNSLPNVWASLENDGAVPDSQWPMPCAQFDALAATGDTNIQDLWNIYYAAVPASVIALGKEFAARFPVLSEWLIYTGATPTEAQILQDLTVAPMEIATAVCAGWNTADPIQGCGAGSQHATLLTFVESGGDYDILDHYSPYQKQFAPNYNITYGMRGVVGQGNPLPPSSFTYDYQVNLTYGMAADADVKALQQGLQTVISKTGQSYMKPGVFGPFGPQTEAALGAFQVDHGISDAPQGHDFGPKSRAALTAALTAQAQK